MDQINSVMATVADYRNCPASILADLWHWCAENGVSFENELKKMRHYIDADLDREPVEVNAALVKFIRVV